MSVNRWGWYVGFADVLAGREPIQGLELPGEGVGRDKVAEGAPELDMALVMRALDLHP